MGNETEIVAWLTAATLFLALLKQGYNIFKSKNQERTAVEEALDKQPQIKQQLELNNIGQAVSIVNQQMVNQAAQLDRAYVRIAHLERREAALEAEVDGWQNRMVECQRIIQEQRDQISTFERFLRSQGFDPATRQPIEGKNGR